MRTVNHVFIILLGARRPHAAEPVDAALREVLGVELPQLVREDFEVVPAAVAARLERGHTRIGYLDAEPSTTAGAQRFYGYVQALHAADIDFDQRLVFTAAATPHGGATATRRLLALDVPPTALVAYNDIMAVGALHACQTAGRRVPVDLAVVGFGDAPLAAWLTPPLTTVQVPLYQIGRQAAHVLLSLLGGEPPRTVSVDLEPILVVRASSG